MKPGCTIWVVLACVWSVYRKFISTIKILLLSQLRQTLETYWAERNHDFTPRSSAGVCKFFFILRPHFSLLPTFTFRTHNCHQIRPLSSISFKEEIHFSEIQGFLQHLWTKTTLLQYFVFFLVVQSSYWLAGNMNRNTYWWIWITIKAVQGNSIWWHSDSVLNHLAVVNYLALKEKKMLL